MSATVPVIDATTEEEVVAAVRDARSDGVRIAVRGRGTLLERIGGPARDARVLSTADLQGVVAYVPEDLIVTVRAGTTLAELAAVLAAEGQECPIEATAGALDGAGEDEPSGTAGGRLASALAGPRQLDAGRVRDWVLRVRFVAGDGSVVTYGGVTVKDVTGYDLSRLMVGSWGSLGVLTEVTLKVRPLARHRTWTVAEGTDVDVLGRLHRPAGVLRDDTFTWVRLEGHPDDVVADMAELGLTRTTAPRPPGVARLAVDPPSLTEVADAARAAGATVMTQDGVGVAHLAGDRDALDAVRVAAEAAGGGLLVLDPTLGIDAFGAVRRLGPLAADVADAIDPDRVMAGRWAR